ncbi:hypothetical protein [Comamonas kerstersii]|nr:hypothetical protein [Comamonas kerstersii]
MKVQPCADGAARKKEKTAQGRITAADFPTTAKLGLQSWALARTAP